MSSFFENPFIEGNLSFAFGNTAGATRYETWHCHLHVFQQLKKKAVDFIYSAPEVKTLFLTEVKDFEAITQIGKYKLGEFSLELANDMAQKFRESLEGFIKAKDVSEKVEERDFSLKNNQTPKVAVLHWEMHKDFDEQKRKHYIRLMIRKLDELLLDVFSRVSVENIEDNPSKYWTVSRIGE